MVEPLVHFSVAFSALAVSGSSSRKAAFAAFFALLPDLDVLLHVHRSMTHSILILGGIAFLAALLTWGTKYWIYVPLAAAGLVSHLLLDLFSGYTPVLWPVYNRAVQLIFSSVTHIGSTPTVTFRADVLTEPVRFEPFDSLDAPIFTSEGLIASAILLVPVLLTRVYKASRKTEFRS